LAIRGLAMGLYLPLLQRVGVDEIDILYGSVSR
jgi:hypothetical protein